jgi:hypothetical protein
MSSKRSAKPYWEMTTKELAAATKDLDAEFVAEKAKSLMPVMRARWARAKAKRSSAKNGAQDEVVAVRLEKQLLDRCTKLAKRKRISRDFLIAWGLRAVLAAEGETE